MPQNTLAVPQRSYSLSRFCHAAGFHGDGVSDLVVESDWLFVHTHHRFFGRQRLFIDLQHRFHMLDIVVVEVGNTPHFFPATAGGRGSATRSGLPPYLGTSLRLTASSAISRTVQR